MTYWGDVEQLYLFNVDVDELRQIILNRFEAGDTLKENELFHVAFDVSTPKNVISALKNMLLGIGVNQCDLVSVKDYLNMPTVPPLAVRQAEILEIEAKEAEAEKSFNHKWLQIRGDKGDKIKAAPWGAAFIIAGD